MPARKQRPITEICNMVAEGKTIREIAAKLNISPGRVIAWVSETEDSAKQYARARDAAADLFEADIITEANAIVDPAASRVKIDALKWIAARRAPKRYSERIQQDHTSSDGSMTPKGGVDLSKLSDAALAELKRASDPD